LGSGKPEDIIKGLPDILGGNKKDKDKNREADPRDRRSSADDGRGVPDQRDAAGRGQQPQDPVGGLLDLAGGLLNKDKSGSKDRNNMRDDRDRGTDRVGGTNRISAEPRTGEAPGERRVSGDEPIGSTRGAAPAATTRSTTAPAERNVSGRTKAQRNRDGQ
jgi:hypothetical protein